MSKSICVITSGSDYNQSRYLELAMRRVWPGKFYFSELGKALPNVDYYFYTDNGCQIYPETPPERNIWWFIDSHLSDRRSWMLDQAKKSRFVFDSTQGVGLEWFKSNNINVYSLPLGFPIDYMWNQELPKIYDVCFVGGRQSQGKRAIILNKVREKFNLFTSEGGTVCNESLRYIINCSKVSLDIPPIEGNFVGQRFYDNLGCQSNCVSLERELIYETTRNDYKCSAPYLYKDENEVYDVINHAIKHPLQTHQWGNIDRFSYDARLKEFFLPIVL